MLKMFIKGTASGGRSGNHGSEIALYLSLVSILCIIVSTDLYATHVLIRTYSVTRERSPSYSSEESDVCGGLSKESPEGFEELRRLVESDVQNTLERVAFQLTRLNSSNTCSALLKDLHEQLRITAIDLSRLGEADELQKWREREEAALSALIQHRLRVIQNPVDCDAAQKIFCDLKTMKSRGIGSQLHYVSTCLFAAYGTQRTLILDTMGFYGNPRGLETFFLPLSDTCTTLNKSQMSSRSGENVGDQHLDRKYYQRSIPKDISKRLQRLHGDPFAWWMGQLFKYVLRMNDDFKGYITNLTQELGYAAPIVGMHVRRTDKLKRSIFIPVEDYMKGVKKYYENLELRESVTVRRIFLATDDPSVISEIQEKYPDYVLIYNTASIQSASPRKRTEGPNFQHLMADVYFLSRSNFLVCGMTSNVCRLSYEIMQNLHPDASSLAYSVDTGYGTDDDYKRGHSVKARYAHTQRPTAHGKEELELKEGDLVLVYNKYYAKNRNVKDGLLYGKNTRTNRRGFFPAYKAIDLVDLADDLPPFDDVDNMNID